MARLGVYSGTQVVQVFKKAGWSVARQRGSHIVMEKTGHKPTLSIPIHKGKDVKRGTLHALVKDAGMTVEEFISYCRKK
jgi:predicted RNA binding protein YcfA (HicA-like mRNA interferase family)